VAIAQEFGGTVDKFIGDAMLVFFGDPETKGVVEDAKACLRRAIGIQRRMAELNAQWRLRGIERPFRTRIGINMPWRASSGETGGRAQIVSEHVPGLDIFLDPRAISDESPARAREVLKSALAALETRDPPATGAPQPRDDRPKR